MTPDKAIEIISLYDVAYCGPPPEEIKEAVDMAIKALEQEPCEDCISRADALSDKGLGEFHFYEDYAKMRNYLKGLPSVTPTQEWFPCSERLPKEPGMYLVSLDYKENGKGVTTLYYHGKHFGWCLDAADTVVAWMPLPEPYEEKSDDKERSS